MITLPQSFLTGKVKCSAQLPQSCPTLATLWNVAHQDPCPWCSPGKNTGVGCHALLWGIFPTQGLKLCLLHCSQILIH